MASQIIWQSGSFFDRLLARVSTAIKASAKLGESALASVSFEEFFDLERSSASQVLVELRRNDAFHDVYSAPVKSERDLQKLFMNEVSHLTPLADEAATLLPTKQTKSGEFSVLQIRSQTLHDLEDHAQKLGLQQLFLSAEDVADEHFEVPVYISQAKRSRTLSAIASALILGGVWIGITSLADHREALADQWSLQELSLRSHIMAQEEVSTEVRAYEAFGRLNPEEVSPQGVLDRIAELTDATPDIAWWTEISLTADTILVSAVSSDAGATLQTISSEYSNAAVEFSGAVSDLRDGKRSFTIKIKDRTSDE